MEGKSRRAILFLYIYIIGKTCRCVTNGRIAKERERKKLIRAQLSTTLFVTLKIQTTGCGDEGY